ncbi:chromate transporter [Caviibacter abscessus]|uniref:chromate transporter n=1 Tax=Caviibacter abscessus TaxID=1766719 RepID=UPI00082F39C0|nr:chromate transporter [Caviibacter abscessus]
MYKNEKINLWQLFITIYTINAFTFGGGYTIVPIIKDKFVKDLKVIDENEMMNIVSIGQSVPGAMAISTSFLVGYKIKGFIGGLIAVIAAVLPCILIITIISFAYIAFINNIYIKAALKGIGAVVSAVLLVTVGKMIIKLVKHNKRVFYITLFFASFILSYFFYWHIALILIISAGAGLLYNRGDKV